MPNFGDAGKAFSAAGQLWTLTLCSADSDGDGLSNGEELGDPCCTCSASLALPNAREFTHPRTKAPRYMEGRDRAFPKLGNLPPRGMQHAKCSIGIRRERKSSMRACVERAVFPTAGLRCVLCRMRQDSTCRACIVACAAYPHAARRAFVRIITGRRFKEHGTGLPARCAQFVRQHISVRRSAQRPRCPPDHRIARARVRHHRRTFNRYGPRAVRPLAVAEPRASRRRAQCPILSGSRSLAADELPGGVVRACVWGLPHTRAV